MEKRKAELGSVKRAEGRGAHGAEPPQEEEDTGVQPHTLHCTRSPTRRTGYASRGVWDDDGPAGVGYRATKEGHALFDRCQDEYYGEEATHDHAGTRRARKHAFLPEAKPLQAKLITV